MPGVDKYIKCPTAFHMAWTPICETTDSCPNGAEMLFQDEEEGEELKT